MIKWFIFAGFSLFTSSAFALQVNGLTYLNTMKPGESAKVSITLTSDRETPELVDLKLCDYWCDSEGHHFFEDVGKQVRSNANWITVGSHREIVKPGEKKDVFLTINVPEDQALKGSYWSVLLIEPSDPLQTLVEPEKGFQLQVKVRYAYHVVTHVGKGTPFLKITDKGFQDLDGKKLFFLDVENTGDLFLNPKLAVKFFNSQGKLEKTLEAQSERLYPGSSSRFLAGSDNLPEGKYTAFLLLDNGDGRIFGDSFDLILP